ncbi:hypothetical protein [Burkholderia sp. Ac-20365]|uniref:hypothetical protein n=1 Tax=Burkholderia sp. Ac-20365 TaxID=2703897 RepID=UPI00197C7A7C|nr:hypothetical protein [Burkholderia sp. Ac-20365]MBN3761024.1 hypothetical protein [Burkholderia sp. Ac-20365]
MIKENTIPQSIREDARVRFAQLRRDVAYTAEEILTAENGFPISIREISDEAAAHAQRWQYEDARSEHVPGWSWPDEVRRFRRRPRRVDAAFYAHDPDSIRLWGLVLGRISDSRVVASIYFLERDPAQNRHAAFVAVASRYLQLFAAAARCSVYAINQPNPALIDYYKDYGFKREQSRKKRVVRLEQDVPRDLLRAAGLDGDEQA